MSFGVRLILLTLLLIPAPTAAQDIAGAALPSPLRLGDAVRYALAHHPALRAADAFEREAGANLDLARARYLPFGDVGLQENRGTGNVVPGTHFTMAGIPPISGPPTDRVFDSGVWGSTAGISLWWDIAHLGEKVKLADAALADRLGAQAREQAERLEIAFEAADAFATLVEATQQTKAAQVSVERARILEKTVNALVYSGLRPGADGARATAETAFAQTELIRVQEAQRLRAVQLSEALGAAGEPVDVVPGHLLEVPAQNPALGSAARNPLVIEVERARDAARNRTKAALLEYIPRVDIVAALFGRANGLFPGGANLGYWQGLVPDTPNWAAGIVITIPILQYPEIRARADVAAADEKLVLARRDEVVQQVQTQIDSARAILDSACKIAVQARISEDSSRAALRQAQARYKAGLYGIDPVAEALRLLAQAEAEVAVSRVDIWRARLLRARAIGDIQPLMDDVNEASGGY